MNFLSHIPHVSDRDQNGLSGVVRKRRGEYGTSLFDRVNYFQGRGEFFFNGLRQKEVKKNQNWCCRKSCAPETSGCYDRKVKYKQEANVSGGGGGPDMSLENLNYTGPVRFHRSIICFRFHIFCRPRSK